MVLHKLEMAGKMRQHRLLQMLKPVAPGLNVEELSSELEEVAEGVVEKLQHLIGMEKAELHVMRVVVGEVIVVELYVWEVEVVLVEHYA